MLVLICQVLTGFWFEVESVVKSIVRDKCTLIMGTPTMIIDILSYVEKNNVKIDSLKCALLGGAAVPAEVASKVQQVIPSCTDVRVGYGATELGPVTSASTADDEAYKKLETVGGPLDYVELKIVDPANNKLKKINERGELFVRGHNVMIGYWNNEEKTKEVITETGCYVRDRDIAVMEETGYIKIVGRTKELVIRGGENIYPREVEDLLHTHSNIEIAAVCGVPDDRVGEELCAWIKLKDPKKALT
ncbi:acyl-CoA synthetase family member 2-like protein, partial [Leptotrombidium deliense]